jgi:hypothetical protein
VFARLWRANRNILGFWNSLTSVLLGENEKEKYHWEDGKTLSRKSLLESQQTSRPNASSSLWRNIGIFYFVGFEVLTAVVMSNSIFWDITPCSPLKDNRRLGGTCHIHLRWRRISQLASYWFPARHIFQFYTQNKFTQTSVARVAIEPTILAFARAQTVHGFTARSLWAGTIFICLPVGATALGEPWPPLQPTIFIYAHTCLLTYVRSWALPE